jgi:hypothetical protein
VASVRNRTVPTKRPPFVSEVSANFFADRGCHVVSLTNPYGHILDFLDRIATALQSTNMMAIIIIIIESYWAKHVNLVGKSNVSEA